MRTSRSRLPRAAALSMTTTLACTVLAYASEARAFCRAVAATPPLNYDPTVSGCFLTDADGDVLPPLFWRNQCVSYSFQKAGSKTISVLDTTRIAAEAFAAWSSAPCPGGGTPNIIADAYPAVDCDSAKSQGHNNVIIFRDADWPYDSVNALGYTTLTIRVSTGEIIGAGIEINSGGYNIVADAPGPDAGGGSATTYDLGSILTHEAGHFLGLAHSADATAVMYAHYHPGTTALTPDDVSGICSIYSPDGTRSTSAGPVAATACNAAPVLGFTSACGALDSGTYVGSGPLPDAGADGTDPPCTGGSSCAVGGAIGSGGAPVDLGIGAFGVLGVAGVLARRRLRRARATSVAAMIAVGAAASALFVEPDAKASVSAEAIFEQLVAEASGAAVVTPIEQRTLWEDGRIATFTRVRIDRRVAGQLPGAGDAWVKTLGGAVGDIAQLVEGEATFGIGQPSLVFLGPHLDPATHAPDGPFVVIERAQGQFPIVVDKAGHDPRAHLRLAGDLGAIVAPPPAHWTQASKRLPPGRSARYVRDVLQGRAVDDAAREIAATWTQLH
jgi:hypothetical protein